jgi:hypothetical protein
VGAPNLGPLGPSFAWLASGWAWAMVASWAGPDSILVWALSISLSSSPCFALGQDRICVSFTLLHFGPVLGVFLCLTCKTSEFSETREMVSLKTPIYIVFGES